MNSIDFVHGIDFTALAIQTAAEHNQLIDLATPEDDGDDDIGKGLNLVTIDSASNVPDVPDATVAGFEKWKRYTWCRKPAAADINRIIRLYVWDEGAVSDATYLKWVQIQTDISSLSADVATALANSATALATANQAAADAASAITTANSLSASVTVADNNASTALATAIAAETTANAATTTALDAKAQAAAALVASAGAIIITRLPISTAPGQTYRSKKDNSAVEFITPQNEYAKYSYRTVKGVHGGASVAGKNVIPFNSEDVDVGNLGTLNAHKITLVPGVYQVIARISLFDSGIQAFLVDDSDNSIILEGTSSGTGTNNTQVSFISGLLTVTNTEGTLTVRVDAYATRGKAQGLGYAINLNPDGAAPHEVYDTIEFIRLGYET